MDKRVLLVNQYFWPDMAATAQLLGDLAEDLTRKGWSVTALCGTGSYVARHDKRLPSREVWNDVEIRRVRCTSFGRSKILGRLMDYSTFLLSAGLSITAGPKYPVVVCLSTPPLVSILGLLAKVRGSRFVYKVEDLYPDVAIALGHLQNCSFITQTLHRVSALVLSRADAVVALDESMAQVLKLRGATSPIVVPNWADGRATFPDKEARVVGRQRFGWEASQLVVLYSGNLGLAHRFDAVLQAAESLEDTVPHVKFVFVGGGPRWEEVKERGSKLSNMEFHPYQLREDLHALYNAADVHLVSLRDDVGGLLVPSKYAAALAVGKPVLLVGGEGSGLTEEIVRREVGWVCRHDAGEISAVLAGLSPERTVGVETGRRARRLFVDRYSRSRNVDLWDKLLSDQLSENAAQMNAKNLPT